MQENRQPDASGCLLKKRIASMIERLKKHIQELGKTLKPMPWKKRIDHLWTYYKSVLVVIIVIASLISIIVTGVQNANRNILISGAMINTDTGADAQSYLTEQYKAKWLAAGVEGEAELTHVQFEDIETTTEVDFTYNMVTRIVAMTAAQELDYVIMNKLGLETYLGHDMFEDLSKILTAEELEQFADKLIYLNYEETGETIPVAVDLQGTTFADRFVKTDAPHYLAFVANTLRPEGCRDLWEYILETPEK